MKYTVALEENEDGELVLPVTQAILDEVGWKEGDTLVWSDNGDGTFTLTRKPQETELVMVEAISQFRMRYCVEVPKGKREYALDTVVMEEAKEFSQLSLGETIVSDRIVSLEDAIQLFREEHNYLTSWSDEQIIGFCITKINGS
jgi:hypothetical protein